MNEAWELSKAIVEMTTERLHDVFNVYDPTLVFRYFNYDEAKAKIDDFNEYHVDADALTKDFLNDYDNYVMQGLRENFHDTIRITDVIERIKDSPTLDYKPIVYCKDCEYRKEHHYEDDGESPYIKYSCKFTKYSMSDIGYCSMGKRRDGEEREQDQRQVKTEV